ncbi:hypothetical protein MTO96_032817 [Rhipicephalus appendiculatus]
MAPLRLSIAIVLVVCAATEVHSFNWKELRDGCNTTDIKKFWNTTEPIWTHTTAKTTGYNFSCLVDIKNNENGSYMIFNRSYYSSSTMEKSTLTLKGLVSPGNAFDQPAMLLYHPNDTLYAVEKLLYASADGQCGVFKFSKHLDVVRIDLRVKNSSVGKELDLGCSIFFWDSYQYHKRREHMSNVTLYDPSCQRILQTTTSGC